MTIADHGDLSDELPEKNKANGEEPGAEAPEAPRPLEPGGPAQPNKPEPPKASGLLLFVAAFVIFSALIAVAVALAWNRTTSATVPDPATQQQLSPSQEARVWGTVDSTAAGLKGHLITKWDGKLNYYFMIEPDDASRKDAFALAVSIPPRPASVRIQIKNPDSVVLCSQDVLLRFDPGKAAAISEGAAPAMGGKRLSARAAEQMKNEEEAELAQENATEAEREHGQSVFQLNAGPNGKIESISSQGEIPCSKAAYEGMGYWSFLPDFPSADEQTEWLNQQLGRLNATDALARQTPGRKRMPYKGAPQPGSFLMVGDDSIVEYDPATGNIETRTGKVFSIDRMGTAARAIAGYDLPVKIRYACDQNAACTLTQGNAMLVHGRLSK